VRLPQNGKIGKEEVVEMFINIEAQTKDNPSYPLISRGFYYCSRLVAKQKNAPNGFQHSEFGKIKKVYSIWICMEHICKKNNVMNTYSTTETCLKKEWHAPKKEYDLMSVIMIYLGEEYPHDDVHHSLLDMLNILFISKASAKQKKLQLSKNYDIFLTEEIKEEVEHMCNFSEGIRSRGLAEGRAKGRAEGKAEGILDLTLQHVTRLMQINDMSVEEVMDMLDVSQNLRPVITKTINKQKKALNKRENHFQ